METPPGSSARRVGRCPGGADVDAPSGAGHPAGGVFRPGAPLRERRRLRWQRPLPSSQPSKSPRMALGPLMILSLASSLPYGCHGWIDHNLCGHARFRQPPFQPLPVRVPREPRRSCAVGVVLARSVGRTRPTSGGSAVTRGPNPSCGRSATLTVWFLCGFYDILASATVGRALACHPAVVDGLARGEPHTCIPVWSRGW